MIIDQQILDNLSAQAKSSPRLRMNFDLRNSADDKSQRMLNALEPGTPPPIHRHLKSSETVVCLRGHLCEIFNNDHCEVTAAIDLAPGPASPCVALNIPIGSGSPSKSSNRAPSSSKSRTARPHRVAANALYQSLGFRRKETNVHEIIATFASS